ncbi:hypothetical protein POM88_024027 [Heracleum sosnowskyi]|uniref:Uncharacterized protein n=1 Tax=Heracleum sosnowskyi TaxID=360622 RepID=A0AAD8IKY4_9APIA|nr:hypothetical protein POM88_024027 [Heracleum sosnowskyi]
MTREKTVPFQSLYNLKWDLGLLDDFDRNLIRKYPDCFRVVKGSNWLACLKLLKWDDEFAVSALQRGKENVDLSVSGNGETELRKFKRGYRIHNRGWRSIYCVTKRDAFRGNAPINLTNRLHQVLRWAIGSVEILFSRNNAFFASSKMKFLQRIAYLNVGIYPFTSFFLIVYCFLPALSLLSGQFIVQSLNIAFLVYLLAISLTLCNCMLAILEIKWSGIDLEEWWQNEQFWLIGGTSAHLAVVLQGLLKVIAIAVGVSRIMYSIIPQWSRLLGGVFFSFWDLAHLYPHCKRAHGKAWKDTNHCLCLVRAYCNHNLAPLDSNRDELEKECNSSQKIPNLNIRVCIHRVACLFIVPITNLPK